MRKTISFIICVVLAASLLTGFAFAAEGLSNFSRVNSYTGGVYGDVNSQSWFEANVKNAYELGLMSGKASNAFVPFDDIKLSETVALAARIHSIYYTGSANFTESGPWYEVYYDYAVENKIIASSQYRSYETAATRDQFVRILVNALPASAMPVTNYIQNDAIKDVDASSAAHVYTFYRSGILTGKDEAGSFCSADRIQRCEAAAIITRMVLPELRIAFSLTVIDSSGSAKSMENNISIAFEATKKAYESFLYAQQAAAGGDTVTAAAFLNLGVKYITKGIEHSKAVCDATKDSEEFAKTYEFASIAYYASVEAANVMMKIPNNIWSIGGGYFETASLALANAMDTLK